MLAGELLVRVYELLVGAILLELPKLELLLENGLDDVVAQVLDQVAEKLLRWVLRKNPIPCAEPGG